MTKLVGLEMPGGQMKQLQMEKKLILTNLKFINLCNSSITRFPNVSGFPNLELLNLSRCRSLVEVDQSVLLHERIIHLNLSWCLNLEILPSFIEMKSLETLYLNQCSRLKRLPEISGEMGRLLALLLDYCDRIKALPLSIRLLTNLIFLSLKKFLYTDDFYGIEPEPGSKRIPQDSTRLTSLRVLHLQGYRLVEDDFCSNLHDLWPSLDELNISMNIVTRLPPTISHLPRLKYLNLSYCNNLEELYELPSLLQVLKANHCTSLQKIGDISNKYKWLFKIFLHGCPKLLKDQDNQSHLDNLLVKSLVQKCAAVNHRLSITVPESKIPNWFTNQQLGNMISLNLPQNQICETTGLAVCCIFGTRSCEALGWLKIKFKPRDKEELIDRSLHAAESGNHMWMGYMPLDFLRNLYHELESEDIVISFEHGDGVLKCGVCVVYKDDVKPYGSCIQEYDKLESFGYRDNYVSASNKDLLRGRRSLPTFFFNNKNIEGQKTVRVVL